MKKFISLLLVFVFVFSVVAPLSFGETTASNTQNNFSVVLSTDKDEYSSSEIINASISVKNSSADLLNDAYIKTTIPDALSLYSGKLIASGVDIASNTAYTDYMRLKFGEMTQPAFIQGDVNRDAKLNSRDIAKIQLHLCGIKTLSSEEAVIADFNHDGKLNSRDIGRVHICILCEFVNSLPAEEPTGNVVTLNCEKTIKIDGVSYTLKTVVKFAPPAYDVVFETNGGSAVESQRVYHGECALRPTNPVQGNYAFVDWYTDPDLATVYNFATPITSNTILYAKWGITRGEWIKSLINKCGYPHTIEGELPTFADISDSEYRSVVETAVVYNILVADATSNFEPNRLASREFAAQTAVKATGYIPMDDIACADVADIIDLPTAKLAVDIGMLELENNHYYPNRILTITEAKHIMNIIESEFNAINDNSESCDGFVFLDNVINKPEPFNWEEANNVIILPEDETVPEVGQILVFANEKAIKIEKVDVIDGKNHITYSTPELYEFLDYIDIQGTAEMDFSNFVPAEGVTILSNSAQSQRSIESSINNKVHTAGFMDDWFDVSESIVDINNNMSLSAKAKVTDNIDVIVDLDINIPYVGYKFDIDFDFNLFNNAPLANVKNAYVKLGQDMGVHVEVVAHNNSDPLYDDLAYPPYIELGSIPLVGLNGIGIVLEIDLVLTAEGKFELDYNVHGSLGVQVRNNKPKNISALQSSSSVGLSGAIKVGPQVKLLAEVFEKDLLSFSADVGIQGKGAVYKRDTGLVCIDAGITVFAELNAFENSLIDDWLDIALKFTIWDEENSPLQLRGHWENLIQVDECTYNNGGTIKGTIANADNRTQYIEGATIKIMDHGTLATKKTVYSNENGEYTAVVPGGTYLIRISADGYIPFESFETVGTSQQIYLETYLMVEGNENSNETGTIGGTISNAVNGLGISNVKLTVRKGWNITTGEVVKTATTNSSGTYSMNLPLGNYTILMERNGYITKHFNVAVSNIEKRDCNAVMNPDGSSNIDLGDMRIILTWTDEPADLDSHLSGPTVNGSDKYHIYYNNMIYSSNGIKHAYLDIDDTSYDGPETTTIYDMTANGTYSFYVHDYTNRHTSNSTVLANSGAKVQVYVGKELIAQYFVPTSGIGNVWHVFDFNAVSGTIKGINTFSSCTAPSLVGRASNLSALNTNIIDIDKK